MKGVPKATNNMTELWALRYRMRITVENKYMPRKINIVLEVINIILKNNDFLLYYSGWMQVFDGDAMSTWADSLLQGTEQHRRLTSKARSKEETFW